jgi:hypothetical protein
VESVASKAKFIVGILLFMIGVGVIPIGYIFGNRINSDVDEYIPTYLEDTREWVSPEIEKYSKYEGVPDTLMGLLTVANDSVPFMVNGSVSINEIMDVINDLNLSLSYDAATDLFFNDPAFTATTSNAYDIQGISEYYGSDLGFTAAARNATLTRFQESLTGYGGFYTFFSEIDKIPIELKEYDNGNASNAVYISGNRAFMAEGINGIAVLDISDINNINQVGHFDDGGEANDIVVIGDYAYVADGSDGFEILDISDISNISQFSQFDDGGEAFDIAVSGTKIYIADGSDGLEIYNFTNQLNPENVTEVGEFSDGGIATNVFIDGPRAFVAEGSAGVEIINISNSTNPVELGDFYDSSGSANAVVVSGVYAYVADGSDGIEILNITNFASPTELGQFDNGGTAENLVLDGDYLFVADNTDGLEIIDIGNKTNPVLVGEFWDGGTALGVQKNANRLYVADGSDGLEIYDVTFPSAKWDMETYYNSTYFQILNVSEYVLEYLFPLVPTIGDIPYTIESQYHDELFFMQWTNLTFIPESWEIQLPTGPRIDNWEANINLNMTTVYNLWNESLATSPLTITGIKEWIWYGLDNGTNAEIKLDLSIDETTFTALESYFFDEDFGNDVVEPVIEYVRGDSIEQIVFENFLAQWANGYLIPKGISSLDPQYEILDGFELVLPPEIYDLGLSRSLTLWDVENIYSLLHPSGIADWLILGRTAVPDYDTTLQFPQFLLEYDFLPEGTENQQEEFMAVIAQWTLRLRDEIMAIQLWQDGVYALYPTEIADIYKLGVLVGGGFLSFLGVILVISYRKR